jgi:HSP20 family protein
MALLQWREAIDPFRELDSLRTAIDRLFGDYRWRTGAYRGVFPALNITETRDNLFVSAEIPGINPKDTDITATRDSITIRGERRPAAVGKEVNYHQREREFGSFNRIIGMPCQVNPDKISASYKEGILTVVVPKAMQAKPKQIEIKTA